MSPEVICISSSPAHLFARSPTPVVCDPPPGREPSPLNSSPPSIPVVSSLLGTPSILQSQRPTKTRKVTPAGKQTDNLADNGSVLSGRIGQENLPLSNSREEKKKVTSRKSNEPKPRRRVTKPAATESAQPTAAKTGPKGKKPRPGKSRIVDKLSNETLGASITKPGTGSAPKVTEKPAKKTRTPSPADPAECHKDSFDWEPGCLELDDAISRKLQWTPPKHSPTPILNLTNDDALSDSEAHLSSANQSFGKLFSTFGYNKQSQGHLDKNQQTGGGAPTNKRRLELVDNSVSTSRIQTPSTEDQANNEGTSRGVEKPKRVQKRKLTTITAYATASYLNDGEKEASLDQYFPKIQGDEKEDTKKKRGSKQQSSKPRQSRKKELGQKKGSNLDFEIFPPEKACKSFADQELVFGTLSQLERDESPTLTRDTQLALNNSESCATPTVPAEAPEPSQGNISLCTSSSIAGPMTSRLVGSRNLWSVAARDFDGSLSKAEVIDLVDTPKASEVLANIGPSPNCNEEWLDIDTVPDTPSRDISLPDQKPVDASNDVQITDSDPNNERDGQSPAESNEDAGDPALPEKPVFAGYSTANLSKQVAKYGFKAIKSRERMITLLEKCWESKHKSTNTGTPNIHPSSAPTTEAPISGGSKDQSRGLGGDKSVASNETKSQRSKNDGTLGTTTQNNNKTVSGIRSSRADGPQPSDEKNEAANANKESTSLSKQAAPNASSLSSARPPSRKTSKAQSTKASTAVSKNRKSLPDLSLRIKSAIESQPAISSDSGQMQLTWHEKILMYDPIVLEDLASWLNTEGLDRIGEDREVSAGFVREWCENEGICCCWKKGLDMSGGSRGAWK